MTVDPGVRNLDYLAFTLPECTSPGGVCDLLELNFDQLGYGGMRYRQSSVASAGGVRVFSDGAVEGMGVHVQISGSGTRLIEGADSFASWREWISAWHGRGAKVARIDISVDDVSGTIPMEAVIEQMKSGLAVTRAKHFQIIESRGPKGTGRTVNIGRRTSESMLRCYDKGMERGLGYSYLRFEWEYKRRKAEAVARLLVELGWDAAVGVGKAFADFKDPMHETSDRTRRRTAPWYENFIGASKHVLRLEEHANDSLTRSHQWVDKQVAPTIAMIAASKGGDLAFLSDLAADGAPRMNERHHRILRHASETDSIIGGQ